MKQKSTIGANSMRTWLKRIVIPSLLLLVAGCATADFKWTGRPFLPDTKDVVQLEDELDHVSALLNESQFRSMLTREWDARQGTPKFVVYSWVHSYEPSYSAGIGVIEGAHSTITTEAVVATFQKTSTGLGPLIDYKTFYIPGLTTNEIKASTTPVVGTAFAIWLTTKIATAISDAGDKVSESVNEGDDHITGAVKNIDDEADARIKKHVEEIKKIGNDLKKRVDSIIDDIGQQNGSVNVNSPSL